jgi:hypothetical protein
VAALLALSDERDLWLRRVCDAWTEGYAAALDDAVVASLLRIWPRPGHVSEIEKRRYPPDGREHFADPRPGDFPGFGPDYHAAEYPPWPPGIPRPSDLYHGRRR